MKNIGFYQSAFVRQFSENDCGIACLRMILRYTGENKAAEKLAADTAENTSESSLLDLKRIIEGYGLNARCVRMDIQTLRDSKSPLILHTVGSDGRFHFLTLFAVTQNNTGFLYVVGDPAYDLKIMCELDICRVWQSCAALYFEDIKESNSGSACDFWKKAVAWHLIPKPLWYCIPFIHLLTFIFAISLSALLQHLLSGSVQISEQKFRAAVLLFILMIIICKGFLTHIRQRLLIRLNKIVNYRLTARLAEKPLPVFGNVSLNETVLKKRLFFIAKFQLSVNGMVSIFLSDGLVLVMLVGVMMYLDIYAALMCLLFMIAAFYIAFRGMPGELFSAMYLNDLHHKSEELLLNNGQQNAGDARQDPERFNIFYQWYISFAGNTAIKKSKTIFRNEAAAGLNMILILGIEMTGDEKAPLLIVSIAALTFLTAIYLQRVNSVLPVIYEGIQAARSLEL